MVRTTSLLSLLVTASLSVLGCHSRDEAGLTSKQEKSAPIAVFDLRAGTPETTLSGGFFPLDRDQTFLGFLQAVDEVAADSEVKAVLVRLGGASYPLAQAQEIAEKLASLREKKEVVCHAHQLSNATAQLAHHACEEIWVTASGSVETVGIAAELSYVKGALDKIGVEADMLAMGRYKSGGEALTRTEPSEDSLRNLKTMLEDMRGQWLRFANQKPDAARSALLEDGPYTPLRARELGLIQRVGFLDEAFSSIEEKLKQPDAESRVVFGPSAASKSENQIGQILRLLAGAPEKGKGKSYIALVPALGSITMGGGGPFSSEEGIRASTMTGLIRRLREDEKVAAIVMRMNSPGGSPLASDLIWRELMLAREVKPVVISVSGMAASGGYYIASAADRIVADPSAIVGSIGVFGGKIVLGGAFEKVGITHFPVAASPDPVAKERALHDSPMQKWDDASRERVRESMQRIYDLFIERVVEGRAMEQAQVADHAEGAIFLATRAKALGLVDQLGGLETAIAEARRIGKLDADIAVHLEGDAESLAEALLLGASPSAAEVEAALLSYKRRQLSARSLLEGSLPLSPAIWGELEKLESSLAPLSAGESVVAALPFWVEVN